MTCLDANSRVFGSPASNLVGTSPGSLETSKVELSNGDVVFLGPLPWVPDISFIGSEATERGAMAWRNAVGANHLSMDDLQATIEVEEATSTRPHLSKTIS